MRGWMLVAWAALAACGKGTVGDIPDQIQCGAEQCKDACADLAGGGTGGSSGVRYKAKTELEQKAVDWVLQEVRRGVRPWSDEAIGICRGRKSCDKFLGPDAGKLSRGTYFVRAQLKVPPSPKGLWEVHFRTDCTTASGETKTFERDYPVSYAGLEGPTELTSLRTIESPSEDGAQECKYTLTTTDASGAKTKYTGRWEVAGKD